MDFTQLEPLGWIIFTLQFFLNQGGIILLSFMNDSEQLLQQHCLENGGENRLLASKAADEIIKMHRMDK